MSPDKIEAAFRGKVLRITGVESLMNVESKTKNTEFLADIASSPASRHGVEDHAGLEVLEEVLNQIATAVTRPLAIAVLTSSMEVIKTCEVRDWAGVPGCQGQPSIYGLDRLGLNDDCGTLLAGSKEWIDG